MNLKGREGVSMAEHIKILKSTFPPKCLVRFLWSSETGDLLYGVKKNINGRIPDNEFSQA